MLVSPKIRTAIANQSDPQTSNPPLVTVCTYEAAPAMSRSCSSLVDPMFRPGRCSRSGNAALSRHRAPRIAWPPHPTRPPPAPSPTPPSTPRPEATATAEQPRQVARLFVSGGPSGRLVETCPAVSSDDASAPVDPGSMAGTTAPESPTAVVTAGIRRPSSTSGSSLRCRRVPKSHGPTGWALDTSDSLASCENAVSSSATTHHRPARFG